MPAPPKKITLPRISRKHYSTSIVISNYAGGPPFKYVDQDGVEVPSARVQKNSKVRWTTSPSVPFALIYTADVTTTAGERVFQSNNKNEVIVPVRGKKVGGDPSNTYEYVAVALKGKKLKIHDPQVIIDD